jgi:hypothetical protein
MTRSNIEQALTKVVVDAVPAPSELALDAIVDGIAVEDTRPRANGNVDVAWPAVRFPL